MNISSNICSLLQVASDVAGSGTREICIGVSSLMHLSSSGFYRLISPV